MPLIKLNAIVAGPDYRGQPGEIIEVSHKDAANLIMANAALPMEPEAIPETAQAEPAPDNAEAPAAPETSEAPAATETADTNPTPKRKKR